MQHWSRSSGPTRRWRLRTSRGMNQTLTAPSRGCGARLDRISTEGLLLGVFLEDGDHVPPGGRHLLCASDSGAQPGVSSHSGRHQERELMRRDRWKAHSAGTQAGLLLVLASLSQIAPAQTPPRSGCLHSKPTIFELKGRAIIERHYGPPNFGDTTATHM